MQNINMEEVMQEIAINMEKRGYCEALEFSDVHVSQSAVHEELKYDLTEFCIALDYMNFNWCNSLEEASQSTNIIIDVWKKGIKKIMRFLLAPLLDFQNAYNAKNVECMEQIKAYLELIEKYEYRINELEKEINKLRDE